MADAHLNPDVVETFRKLLDEHKKNIRLMVLEELIGECYGPQALLNGRRITTIPDFKDWLEAKLQQAKEHQAKEAGVSLQTFSPTLTRDELKQQWAAKRKAAE